LMSSNEHPDLLFIESERLCVLNYRFLAVQCTVNLWIKSKGVVLQ
jgi:hypothetical protein